MSGRSLVIGALMAGLALPGIAAACVQPNVKSSFDLHALQSRLMVVALSCRGEAQDRYDSVVLRFRQDLQGAHRQVSDYLRRIGGNRKVEQYMADLANVHARESLALGQDVCESYRPLWNRLAEARAIDDVNQVAAALPEQTLVPLQVCAPRGPQLRSAAAPAPAANQQVAASPQLVR